MESQNRLAAENCNTAKCKSCIFRNDDKALKLSPERMQEIQTYLANGTSSHICHNTQKTCYGALEFQAQCFFAMKFIPEPTVESLLLTARKALGL
jgi:hypothetical protein